MTTMADTIKQVAVDLFFRKGYFATSISEIARGCGIQKASIYYHFPGKEDLLFCIMNTTMCDLMAYLQRNLAGTVSIDQQVRAAVHSHVSFHLNRQKETFIASSELRGLTPDHYEAIVTQRDAYESIFQDLIREGIALKVFAPGDVKILSYAILTLCTAGASWFNPRGRLSVDGIAGIYETFILNGLQAGAQWSHLQLRPTA
ncbi:MAG: TetR/AcrR family transcriptional regulator [Planctomycetaceae bacterium]|nr:MAG: TetR/AcrR family transcriptional regulator [Planctomycetaceae bacterium]